MIYLNIFIFKIGIHTKNVYVRQVMEMSDNCCFVNIYISKTVILYGSVYVTLFMKMAYYNKNKYLNFFEVVIS